MNLKQEHKFKIKCFVLVSIILPLIVLGFVFVTQQEQLVKRLLKVSNHQQLCQKIEQVREILQLKINEQKIRLKYMNEPQQKGQPIKSNAKQRKFLNLIRQIDELRQSQLKYFTFNSHSQTNSSEFCDLDNQLRSIQIKGQYEIDLIKQLEQITELSNKLPAHQRKNPLQSYDKIVFKVVLMNINQDQHPLPVQIVNQLEHKLINHHNKHSYLKPIIMQHLHYNQTDERGFEQSQIIKIGFKRGHLSQLEQNYQSKIRQFFQNNKNNLIINQNQQQNINNKQQFEYYMQDIMDQLQATNKATECHYYTQHINCQQFVTFLLYQSNQDINYLVSHSQQGTDSVIELEQKESKEYKQLQYWTREDKSFTLITFHPQNNKNKVSQSPTLISTLEELLYQQLNLSPLLLLVHSQTQPQQTNIKLKHKLIINNFINLNIFYNHLHILKQVKLILTSQNIPYTSISNQQQGQVIKILETIKQSLTQQDIKDNLQYIQKHRLLNTSLINTFNQIDPFPNDYKLGALLPIAIILLYPLLAFIKLLLT